MQPVTEPGKPVSESLGITASMRCDNDQAGEILEGEVSTQTDLIGHSWNSRGIKSWIF